MHIKAQHLRNKTCHPIYGGKPKPNDAVLRDRKIAVELISFKYPNIVVTEGWLVNDLCTLISSCLEAYRMTGNLEMKLEKFNSDVVKTKDL